MLVPVRSKMNRFEDWYKDQVQKDLVYKLGVQNPYQLPKLEKVVLNMGVGAGGRFGPIPGLVVLSLLGGQRAQLRPAKKSIAGFHLRSQRPIGCKLSLRGRRGYAFLEDFVSFVLPSFREFQAFSSSSVDGVGNLHFGVDDVAIFPSLEVLTGHKFWAEFFVGGEAAAVAGSRTGATKSGAGRGKWKAKPGGKKKKVDPGKGMGLSLMGMSGKGGKGKGGKGLGMNVSVVTTTTDAAAARVLFTSFQLPFRV
jgi:large subunit ribosomal protein L5